MVFQVITILDSYDTSNCDIPVWLSVVIHGDVAYGRVGFGGYGGYGGGTGDDGCVWFNRISICNIQVLNKTVIHTIMNILHIRVHVTS